MRRRHWIGGLAGALLGAAHAAPSGPPAALRLQGEARMRWFGLTLYDIRLWADTPLRPDWWEQDLGLELIYARALRGRDIAQRSLDEMRRQGPIAEARAARWLDWMQDSFPDVAPGDRLAGRLRPGRGAAFSHNERPRAEIDDPEFARLFFGIWLSPRTSEPALRRQLLGLTSS